MNSPTPLSTGGSGAHVPRWRQRRTDGRGERRSSRDWKFWGPVIGVVLVVVLVTAIFSYTELDWTDVHDALQRLPAALAITLMALLPLGGFSVAVVYLVAGAKFGPVMGGVVVTAVTAVHLIGSNWIARSFLRGPLERFLARRNHSIPKVLTDAQAPVAVMAALVPGVPYFARNYLLPMSGIPLRKYFWICLPIYVARSYVTIFLGDLSGAPSMRRLLILGAVLALKLTICGFIIARLRRRQWRADDGTKRSTG